MNNKLIEKLRVQLENNLKTNQKRYQHSLGVANTCACLAMRYGLNIENAYIAGLFHDCAKCLDDETLVNECEKNNLPISEYERKSPYLLHGKLGAYYVDKFYDIHDIDIQNAIEFHTTGHADMSQLEMIVFISDYIEPLRNQADQLDQIRKMAFENLEKTVCKISEDTLRYLTKKQSTIDPTTVETYDYYKKIVNL